MAVFARILCLAILPLMLAACGPKRSPAPVYFVAESALRQGSLREAASSYRLFIGDPGKEGAPYVPRAYYMLAFTYYRLGQYEDALAALDEMEERFPQQDWVQVWALRGDTSRALGKRVRAIQEWDEAWQYAGRMDRLRLQQRIERTLAEMTPEEVATAEAAVGDQTVRDLLAKKVVETGAELVPDPKAAIEPFDAESDVVREARVRPRAESARRAEWREIESDEPGRSGSAKVVCLVPSASDADGARVIEAVRSAFGERANRVVEREVGATTASARAAWIEAVEDSDVVAAVALLPDDTLRAVAPLAESAGVPLIALGARRDAGGRYVRGWAGPAPEQEAAALVAYVVDTVRVGRFGVLAPETPSGQEYAAAFRAEARRRGADVVVGGTYRPGQGGWGNELALVRKWRHRDINVEAVFVPDAGPEAVGLALALNEKFPDLIVLGVGGWASPAMRAPGLRAFVPGSPDAGAADAASLLHAAIAGGAGTRTAVHARLAAARAAGAESRAAGVLRIQGGAVEEVGG